jgi:hypothetical protein
MKAIWSGGFTEVPARVLERANLRPDIQEGRWILNQMPQSIAAAALAFLSSTFTPWPSASTSERGSRTGSGFGGLGYVRESRWSETLDGVSGRRIEPDHRPTYKHSTPGFPVRLPESRYVRFCPPSPPILRKTSSRGAAENDRQKWLLSLCGLRGSA